MSYPINITPYVLFFSQNFEIPFAAGVLFYGDNWALFSSPVQAWTGPEDSRRLRLPDFKTIGSLRW